MPLVSASIIQSFGWRWVFGIVAMIVAMNFVLVSRATLPGHEWSRLTRSDILLCAGNLVGSHGQTSAFTEDNHSAKLHEDHVPRARYSCRTVTAPSVFGFRDNRDC